MAFVNVTSRHTPVQSVTLPPVQLTALKQPTTSDPVLARLEKSGFVSVPNSRPASAVTITRSKDDKDLQCINAALEVERNRLVEFVQTLQKRLDQANVQHVDQENKLIEYRKMNARLEKEMDKVKLDLNNVKNRTGTSSSSSFSLASTTRSNSSDTL